MADAPTWQVLLAIIGVAALIFFMRPTVKTLLERSREAPKDWQGAIFALGAVVLLVLLLILSVR